MFRDVQLHFNICNIFIGIILYNLQFKNYA
jgi:hypothetical protein